MAVIATYTHDPDAVLDYSVDWTAWLAAGDTIVTSEWAVDPTGPTISLKSIDGTGKLTTMFFEGGTAGSKYTVTNHIVTADGREDDRSIAIKIVER